ncbi:hypothetical protein HWV62_42092 [Athelia sp. TMB]|nr:hypothetical protein HWV62_42092 [Athelia sp. TMB]
MPAITHGLSGAVASQIANSVPDLTGQVVYQNIRGTEAAASGAHGHVYRGTWTTSGGTQITVAVKIIVVKRNITSEVNSVKLRRFIKVHTFAIPVEEFYDLDFFLQRGRREMKVWQRTHHENVVPFLGITTDIDSPFTAPNPVAMVSLWMEGGNLLKALETNIMEPERLHLANILINAKGDACLTDFGLSVILPEFLGTSYWSRTAGGAMRWRAPELLPPPSLDVKEIESYEPALTRLCDIYSFGSVALHALSLKLPYHNIEDEATVVILVSLRMQPSRPRVPQLTNVYWDLIEFCWGGNGDPSSRPSIGEIAKMLQLLCQNC